MVSSTGVNICTETNNKNLLRQIDKIVREESRTRSELIREAARLYIERKSKWIDIFSYAKHQASHKNLKEDDVISEIRKYRYSSKNITASS